MLCGAIVAASPPSLAYLHVAGAPRSPGSPPAHLAAALRVMAATHLAAHLADQDDDNSFIENGLVSYENPNYHLDPSRLDAALYGGMLLDAARRRALARDADEEKALEYERELDQYDNRRAETLNDDDNSPTEKSSYDINGSEKQSLLLSPDGRRCGDGSDSGAESPPEEKERADLEANEKCQVPHEEAGPNRDLYALPVKRRIRNIEETLPPGWEKHEDNDGPYYWHIKSGTIQREVPAMPPQEGRRREDEGMSGAPLHTSFTRSTTSSALDADYEAERRKKEEISIKRRSFPARGDSLGSCGLGGGSRAVRFFVRSLGRVEIAEADLTPERSSRAVNRCIVDLSLGRNDLRDVVGRWGDGKDLFMDLDEGALKLIDPENLTTLHTQPIHTIRVWGVGRDNGRDFAYVARDRTSRRHMCHVFRCEVAARAIANALRDICKRIMIERTLAAPPHAPHAPQAPARPTDLPTDSRRHRHATSQSFPTPMEEPRKVVRAQYLGSLEVSRATGMAVLNDAVERLAGTTDDNTNTWRHVSVAVAPSMISITQDGDMVPLAECRVRYLSFLGIARDVRRCAFIMHTAQDLYVAHAFHCEPSSGALCKTIEAACKLRYQKCLDAHPGGGAGPGSCVRSPGARGSLGATIKSLVGSLGTLAARRPS